MSTARAVEAVIFEYCARGKRVVRELSVGFPFLLFLHYVGSVIKEVPFGVYLGWMD